MEINDIIINPLMSCSKVLIFFALELSLTNILPTK